MLSVESAISRFRRDLTLAALVRFALAATAGMCLLVGPFVKLPVDTTIILMVVAAIWLFLSFRSARSSQVAQASSSLIASGQFEQAEQQIELSLRTFSLFRSAKLMTLHHLALLRHAQNRYPESAMLCQALLAQRLGTVNGLSKSSRLMLADALLEMGDARGAYDAMIRLHEERLSLGEAVQLLMIELDYGSRVGAWDYMLNNIMTKVQLAEIMPTQSAARAQAMLALAAKKLGRGDWSDWLAKRAALLVDPAEMVIERPVLKELYG